MSDGTIRLIHAPDELQVKALRASIGHLTRLRDEISRHRPEGNMLALMALSQDIEELTDWLAQIEEELA